MFSRNLDKAREAYKKRDIELSKQAHGSKAPQIPSPESNCNLATETTVSALHPENHKKGGEFIKSIVYGGLDGIQVVISVVTGSHGASLSPIVILIIGIATLIGSAISQACGNYLSTKAEIEFQACEKKREEWEVDNNPEEEKIEMVELYRSRGLSEEDAQLMANTLSKSKKAWVEIMMIEELGMIEVDESPGKNAIITFISFLIFGILPLLPYCANVESAKNLFEVSLALTAFALMFMGFVKSLFSESNVIKSSLETLFLGSFAAGSAYLIGWSMEGLA